MSTQYYVSEVGLTAPVGPTVGGLGDKVLCKLYYNIDVTNTGLAGFLTARFRWRNRQGQMRTGQSVNVSLVGGLLGPLTAQGVINFQSEDAAGLGAFFEWEIAPTSVGGSYAYDFWVHVDGEPGN